MTTMNDLIGDIDRMRRNPSDIQRVVHEALDVVRDGRYDVVDPSNPFVFLMEAGVAMASANFAAIEANSRRQYPSLAQTESDLYYHMSDVDHVDRFARPSRVTFTILMSKAEIYDRAIEVDGGIRKMVIPRDTEFTIEGYYFTLQYPIEIRVMPHGGLQIVYDVDILSPLETLESNVVDWRVVRIPSAAGSELGNLEVVELSLPIQQFRIQDYYDQLNASSGFNKTYAFDNEFYYARIYTSTGTNGEWEEIYTTHSDQVYDPTKPTAVLKVVGNQITVFIPQIYFTRGLLGQGIRVDIYSTRGELDLLLERYEPRFYRANWRDLSVNQDPLIRPIQQFSTITMYSTGRTSGGRGALTFDQLRERVINNALGQMELPITANQLQTKIEDLDYNIVKDVDTITHRTYKATRALPVPNQNILRTAIGCTVMNYQTTFDKLGISRWAYENNQRLTLAAGAMFEIKQGVLRLLTNNEYDQMIGGNAEQRALIMSEKEMVYTPFHYVMDTTDDFFEVRAYYLDQPVENTTDYGLGVHSKEFIAENESANLQVATLRYGLSRHDAGYKLVIITRTGQVMKDMVDDRVHVQLSFIPVGEVERAYLNGLLVGRTEDDEYIFEFDIGTNFDIDRDDRLKLTTFKMYSDEPLVTTIDLTTELDLMYIVSNYYLSTLKTTSLDDLQGKFMLPEDCVSVAQERLKLSFGTPLSGLWRRSRSVVGSQSYRRYTADVPAYYDRAVYKRDATGAIELTPVTDGDGNVTGLDYQILHNAGDPVLDAEGNQYYTHLAGDVMLDAYGQPIVETNRLVERQMDLLLFDGVFQLVTDSTAIKYARQTTDQVVRWVSQDIESIQGRLLENTDIWYYPQVSKGSVAVTVEEGVTTTIDSEQSLTVKYYLTKLAYDNLELRTDLTSTALDVVSTLITDNTISTSRMTQAIKDQTGDDVLDVVVSGLGGDADYELVTLKDSAQQISIKKRPVVLPDNTLTVEDAVTVEFVRHTT